MDTLPSGCVTFLFSDIEGSTRLFEQHPDRMPAALARHHALLRDVIRAHRGVVFNVVGDGVCVAFERPDEALLAALSAQRAIDREPWGPIGAVRARIGLHAGEAEAHDGEYVSSLTLARAQRVMAAGHGGQTLLSAATAALVRPSLPAGATLRDLGAHRLRGLAEPEVLFQLVAADLPSDFPPLRAETAASAAGAPLHELVRGRLVGRSAELAQLERHWDQAQQARGQLVLLSGEPGVGKTRLAHELIAHARSRGATVLRGGCYEHEATTPYLPIVEALREWVRSTRAESLRAALGTTAAEIAKLAPEVEAKLGAVAPNASLSAGEQRLRLFDNVARLLQTLAADRGLLVFVDDLHWADHGTLALLHYALRHLRNDRVLVLATYREVELDRSHPLANTLVDWNRERLATRVALSRLSRADTATLIATLFGQESVSDDFADVLFRETEGNPFFLEEVVKSLIEQGEIYRENGEWQRNEAHELAVPQSVKEAIGRRLTRLTDATVDVLRTAAALGKIFAFDDLAAVADADADALLDALDAATAAQLVRPDASGAGGGAGQREAIAFTHDKIREVLYEELSPVRRRRLHQRVGEALERLQAAPNLTGTQIRNRAQDLAFHFAQAGDFARSLTWSRRAASDAERVFAHDEALQFLHQAREAAEAIHDTAAVAAVDEQIGDICESRGVIRDAVESYERALAAAPTRAARAALKAKIGNAYVPVGDPRGLAYLEEALIELDPATQQNELALSTALVGRYFHYRTEHTRAIDYLMRALRLAEPLGDPPTLSSICTFLAGAHQHLMQYEESNAWARRSIEIGERSRLPLAVAAGNEFLAENAAGRGLWDEAYVFAERDADEGRRIGALARVAWGDFSRAQALHGKGELAAALATVVSALAMCAQIGEDRLATWLEPLAAQIAADLGDAPAALDHAQRGWTRAEALNQLLLTVWALNGLGVAALQRADYPAALSCYEKYVALVRDTENAIARNLIVAHAAEAFLHADRLDEAAQLAAQATAYATRGRAPHYLALAQRVHGQILAARGRGDDALGAFDEALGAFTRIGSRLEAARVVYHRARLRQTCGDADGSRRDASVARDEFAAMAAEHDRVLAEALLS